MIAFQQLEEQREAREQEEASRTASLIRQRNQPSQTRYIQIHNTGNWDEVAIVPSSLQEQVERYTNYWSRRTGQAPDQDPLTTSPERDRLIREIYLRETEEERQIRELAVERMNRYRDMEIDTGNGVRGFWWSSFHGHDFSAPSPADLYLKHKTPSRPSKDSLAALAPYLRNLKKPKTGIQLSKGLKIASKKRNQKRAI